MCVCVCGRPFCLVSFASSPAPCILQILWPRRWSAPILLELSRWISIGLCSTLASSPCHMFACEVDAGNYPTRPALPPTASFCGPFAEWWGMRFALVAEMPWQRKNHCSLPSTLTFPSLFHLFNHARICHHHGHFNGVVI